MPTEKTQPNRTLEDLFIREYEQLKAEKIRLEAQIKQNNMVIDELASQLTDIKEFIKKYGSPISVDKFVADDFGESVQLNLYFSMYSWDHDSDKLKIYNKIKHLWPVEKEEEKTDEK